MVIDADLQDPPEVVLDMVQRWLQGADVVYGIRTKRKEPLLKRGAYKSYYKIFQWLANIDARSTPVIFRLSIGVYWTL